MSHLWPTATTFLKVYSFLSNVNLRAVANVPNPSVQTLDKKLKWGRKVVYLSPSRHFCMKGLYAGYLRSKVANILSNIFYSSPLLLTY